MPEAGRSRGRPQLEPQVGRAWSLLGWGGLALGLIGAIDVALVWWPMHFGQPQWEFASVSASMNGLPLPVLGLLLFAASALALAHRARLITASVLMALLAVAILAVGVIYALTLPMALDATTQPMVALGLKKAVAKTVSQLVLYPVLLVLAAAFAWRRARTGT